MLDYLVVGSGFAGLSLAYRLRDAGFTVQVLEAGSDVGGTWYWNRYPGAYCDIESLEYQLGLPTLLQQEWRWQGKFASQREIEAYLQFVADRLELRPMIQFSQFVEKAQWDESTRTWQIATRQGLAVAARHVVFATGCLSKAQYPRIAGLDTFRGQLLHTGAWPREGVDFTGKRVAVIGTGSSGVQVIPEIARQAQRLYVFQRTANYVLPVRNELLSDDELARRRAAFVQERKAAFRSPAGVAADAPLDRTDPALTPEKLEAELERRWNAGNAFSFLGALPDVFVNLESNRIIADFFRKKIRQIVKTQCSSRRSFPGIIRSVPSGSAWECTTTMRCRSRMSKWLISARAGSSRSRRHRSRPPRRPTRSTRSSLQRDSMRLRVHWHRSRSRPTVRRCVTRGPKGRMRTWVSWFPGSPTCFWSPDPTVRPYSEMSSSPSSSTWSGSSAWPAPCATRERLDSKLPGMLKSSGVPRSTRSPKVPSSG
ncbi:MAG: NAD(P)/FAD-dependent oxidoreductase [Proteobacteria bacterium]|nr:NAD(P)/FAD-dependent oxidoreductase [Pseudomonadota bacterium]